MARWLSDETLRLCTESGQLPVHVDVYDWHSGDRLLTSRSGDEPASVSIVGGSITTDQSRDIPGTGSLDIVIDDATAAQVLPVRSSDALSPVRGAEVQVSFGHEGEETWYGRYEISDATPEEAGEGVPMGLELADNARRIERVGFFRPRVIARKTPFPSAFKDLIWQVLPHSRINCYPFTRVSALHTYNVGDNRLAAVKEFADAVAAYIDWNDEGRGHVSIQPWPSVEADPVWVFSESGSLGLTRNGVLTGASRRLSDEDVYNGVICQGESAGSDKPPVRGEWWDRNKLSPTYFDPDKPLESAFGPHPFHMRSSVVTTTAQAVEAARAKLPQVAGMTERLALTTVRHPGVEPGDPIYVHRPRIGAEGVFIVEGVTMPLLASEGLMTINCRERRIFE